MANTISIPNEDQCHTKYNFSKGSVDCAGMDSRQMQSMRRPLTLIFSVLTVNQATRLPTVRLATVPLHAVPHTVRKVYHQTWAEITGIIPYRVYPYITQGCSLQTFPSKTCFP